MPVLDRLREHSAPPDGELPRVPSHAGESRAPEVVQKRLSEPAFLYSVFLLFWAVLGLFWGNDTTLRGHDSRFDTNSANIAELLPVKMW